MAFSNVSEARRAYDSGAVDLHARVKVRITAEVLDEETGERNPVTEVKETTVGRSILIWEACPPELPFDLVNRRSRSARSPTSSTPATATVGLKETVIFADQLMYTGFTWATRAGVSIGVEDMEVPADKKAILDEAESSVEGDRGPVPGGLRHRGRALQQGRRHLVTDQRAGGARDDGQARRRP